MQITVNGQRVTVSENFAQLSRAEQDATVDEIARSMGSAGPRVDNPPATPNAPTISVGDQRIPLAEYQALPQEQRDVLRGQIAQTAQYVPQPADGSAGDPLMQGLSFGWADEARGLRDATGAAAQGQDFGGAYSQSVGQSRADLGQERAENPWGSLGLEVAGSIPTAMGLGGQFVGRGSTLMGRAFGGAAVGAGQGAAYGAGASPEGQKLMGAAAGAGTGAAIGGLAPFAGNMIANRVRAAQQGSVLNRAAKNAPTATEMKSAGSALFTASTGANISLSRPAFQRLFNQIRTATSIYRPNQALDPKAMGALQVVQQTLDDVMAPGSNVLPDMQDLHILRQAAQRAALSTDGRDATIANQIVNQIDDFVQNLRPADIAGGADPTQAANSLLQGISTWSQASKLGMIEEAIRVGELAASGPEKGIRNAFRRLLTNPNSYRLFSEAERQAIQDVVNGSGRSNLLKLMGTFGFGANQATTGTGGAIGMGLGSLVGGPVGMIAAPIIGSLAKAGSERATMGLANRALGAAATPGLASLPPVNPAQATIFEQLMRQMGTPIAGQVGQVSR